MVPTTASVTQCDFRQGRKARTLPPICAAAAPASLTALARANGLSALMPPFAEPFISGQDAGLELAPVINAGDLHKGLSRLC